MTRSRTGRAMAIGGLGVTVCLIIGLVPVVFLDATRRAGSIGKLSALGLLAIAAVVVVISALAGTVLYRIAVVPEMRTPDLWVVAFIAFATWSVGVLTLVPGLVFLRLSDNRSLNDFGVRFFVEWALVDILVALAALALGRWSLGSLSKVRRPWPVADA